MVPVIIEFHLFAATVFDAAEVFTDKEDFIPLGGVFENLVTVYHHRDLAPKRRREAFADVDVDWVGPLGGAELDLLFLTVLLRVGIHGMLAEVEGVVDQGPACPRPFFDFDGLWSVVGLDSLLATAPGVVDQEADQQDDDDQYRPFYKPFEGFCETTFLGFGGRF